MTLIDLAHQALEELVADPKTPAAIRYRAAQTILRQAAKPEIPESRFARALRNTDQGIVDLAPHDALRKLERETLC